jgi:hypothetical protein
MMLAIRHLEDARMRLGKAMQHTGSGVSIYDKDPAGTIAKLQKALTGLVGADSKDDLEKMELFIRSNLELGPDSDTANILNAIHTLLELQQQNSGQNDSA